MSKKIKILSKTYCAGMNYDCVVAKLLELGHKSKGKYHSIHSTGNFYTRDGESEVDIIYDNGESEESSLWDVCQAADIELDDDMKDEEEE